MAEVLVSSVAASPNVPRLADPGESHRTTVRLLPVTDGDRNYFEWASPFEAAPERTAQLRPIMEENFLAGARALQERLG